jgi:tagatose-1,6-bisphosphate aldolase non-catalytic subunit AgaZ/GatZ
MPNLAHEALARALAIGLSPAQAYAAAGFRDLDLVAALALAERPDVQARVAELKAADAARALTIAEWRLAKRAKRANRLLKYPPRRH